MPGISWQHKAFPSSNTFTTVSANNGPDDEQLGYWVRLTSNPALFLSREWGRSLFFPWEREWQNWLWSLSVTLSGDRAIPVQPGWGRGGQKRCVCGVLAHRDGSIGFLASHWWDSSALVWEGLRIVISSSISPFHPCLGARDRIWGLVQARQRLDSFPFNFCLFLYFPGWFQTQLYSWASPWVPDPPVSASYVLGSQRYSTLSSMLPRLVWGGWWG